MPTIRYRLAWARPKISSGIGGGVLSPANGVAAAKPQQYVVLPPEGEDPKATAYLRTLEEQLEASRKNDPNGYLPDNMKQVNDVTTVRGEDAYNAAQTAAEVTDHLAATVADQMVRVARLAEEEGDLVTAEEIDTMLREAAGGRFQRLKNWLNADKMRRFFSGRPEGWDELEKGGSLTGRLNPDAWAWDDPRPMRRDHYVRDPQHPDPLIDTQRHGPFADLALQQSAWGQGQHVGTDAGRAFDVRDPAFNSLNHQMTFDRNLNRALGVGALGATALGGAAVGDAVNHQRTVAEYQRANEAYQAAGGPNNQAVAPAYLAYTRALLGGEGDVETARQQFQAALQMSQASQIAAQQAANAPAAGQPQPSVGSRYLNPRATPAPMAAQPVTQPIAPIMGQPMTQNMMAPQPLATQPQQPIYPPQTPLQPFASRVKASVRFAAAPKGRDKGSLEWHGLKLYIENPKNSWREKTGADGKKWRRKMAADYGRINGTKGADGDCIDAFIGPHDDSTKCYVVDQLKKDGGFDEHKCVLGCKSRAEAKALYLANYPKGWQVGGVTEFSLPEFKKWLSGGDKKKPAAD